MATNDSNNASQERINFYKACRVVYDNVTEALIKECEEEAKICPDFPSPKKDNRDFSNLAKHLWKTERTTKCCGSYYFLGFTSSKHIPDSNRKCVYLTVDEDTRNSKLNTLNLFKDMKVSVNGEISSIRRNIKSGKERFKLCRDISSGEKLKVYFLTEKCAALYELKELRNSKLGHPQDGANLSDDDLEEIFRSTDKLYKCMGLAEDDPIVLELKEIKTKKEFYSEDELKKILQKYEKDRQQEQDEKIEQVKRELEEKVTTSVNELEEKVTTSVNELEEKVITSVNELEEKVTTSVNELEEKVTNNITKVIKVEKQMTDVQDRLSIAENVGAAKFNDIYRRQDRSDQRQDDLANKLEDLKRKQSNGPVMPDGLSINIGNVTGHSLMIETNYYTAGATINSTQLALTKGPHASQFCSDYSLPAAGAASNSTQLALTKGPHASQFCSGQPDQDEVDKLATKMMDHKSRIDKLYCLLEAPDQPNVDDDDASLKQQIVDVLNNWIAKSPDNDREKLKEFLRQCKFSTFADSCLKKFQ